MNARTIGSVVALGVGAALLVLGCVVYLISPQECLIGQSSGGIGDPVVTQPTQCYPDPGFASWSIPLWAVGVASVVGGVRVRAQP